MNENIYIADDLLQEGSFSRKQRKLNNQSKPAAPTQSNVPNVPLNTDITSLKRAYDLAYPHDSRGGKKGSEILTPDEIERSLIAAVEDNADYAKNEKSYKNQKQRLAAAVRIIGRPGFVAKLPDADDNNGPERESPEIPDDIPEKKWPKYSEFRKKWYIKTCELGWPKDVVAKVKDEDSSGSIKFPWSKTDATAYAFNARGTGTFSIKNYTKVIQDKLYDRFHNDNKGLQKLLNQVTAICEVEKTYFGGRPLRNFMSSILSMAWKGIGGSAGEEQMLRWLLGKIKGMTVFEYQKFILEEMNTKMSLDDTTLQDLKNMLNPIRAICMKIDGYEPSQVKGEYSEGLGFICSFRMESKVKSKEIFEAQSYLDMIDHIIIPIVKRTISKGGTWHEQPEVNELVALKRKLMKFKDEKAKGERITKAIPKVYFLKHKKATGKDDIVGDYKINFKYLPYRTTIQIIYIPKGEEDDE